MPAALRNNEPLMTTADVAEYLQVSENTVIRWREELSLPFDRLGRAIRYRRSKVDAWIDEQNGRAA